MNVFDICYTLSLTYCTCLFTVICWRWSRCNSWFKPFESRISFSISDWDTISETRGRERGC